MANGHVTAAAWVVSADLVLRHLDEIADETLRARVRDVIAPQMRWTAERVAAQTDCQERSKRLGRGKRK